MPAVSWERVMNFSHPRIKPILVLAKEQGFHPLACTRHTCRIGAPDGVRQFSISRSGNSFDKVVADARRAGVSFEEQVKRYIAEAPEPVAVTPETTMSKQPIETTIQGVAEKKTRNRVNGKSMQPRIVATLASYASGLTCPEIEVLLGAPNNSLSGSISALVRKGLLQTAGKRFVDGHRACTVYQTVVVPPSATPTTAQEPAPGLEPDSNGIHWVSLEKAEEALSMVLDKTVKIRYADESAVVVEKSQLLELADTFNGFAQRVRDLL